MRSDAYDGLSWERAQLSPGQYTGQRYPCTVTPHPNLIWGHIYFQTIWTMTRDSGPYQI